MNDLLHHYERELAFLRERARSFAERYPKIAGRLQVSSEVAEDPHVERMIESFALLTSRIHKRLDDDFPLFTESLLEVLYPHYLRPLPSASIVQFAAPSQASETLRVPRGTLLTSRVVQGVECRFRTCFDLPVLPLTLAAAQYRAAVSAPAGTRLPDKATSQLSLRVDLTSSPAGFAQFDIDRLRFYLDGDPAQVSALREALVLKAIGIFVQPGGSGPWIGPLTTSEGSGHRCRSALPELAGFEKLQSLLDNDARSHPAYRLLTEYFVFPEKFSFIDLPWPKDELREAQFRSLTLHIVFANVRSDSDQSRMLEEVTPHQLKLGCTPIVNLFARRADPIRVTHQLSSYPLVVDSRHAFAHELYSIDKVYRVQSGGQGDQIDEFRPFYSLRHGQHDEGDGRYWHAHRDESMSEESPGYETLLSIVDVDFNPTLANTDTLSVEVTATNRHLPSQLPFGGAEGDFKLDERGSDYPVRLLRKPTASFRFARDRGALWRLISHLSLNHLSLSSGGAEALREMLNLYDISKAASNRRQIEGIVAVDYRPTTAWLAGEPFASFVRGMEVRITLDEEAFVGSGLAVFVELLDRFFGLYVHANSFSQLVVLSARSGEELFKRAPRSGGSPLV